MIVDEGARLARDSFYVTVGFGVLTFQKLQVRRRELESQLERRDHRQQLERSVQVLQSSIGTGVSHLDDQVTAIERHVDPVFDDVTSHLPAATRDALGGVRDAARSTRGAVVDLIARRSQGTESD